MTTAVLSWGSHKTLLNTLTSYQILGLDVLDTERIIFFQEITETDKEIARRFGYRPIGYEKNIGIAQAYKRLVEESTGDLFLFLENDWTLIQEPHDQIYTAAELLRGDFIDVARFRHRRFPGDPLYTRQFKGKELEHPTHLLDAIHWEEDMEKFWPHVWSPTTGWWAANANNANWTNNPTMFRTQFLRDNIIPRIGSRDAEIDLQPWWEQQNFIVAQGEGLFTHNRIG